MSKAPKQKARATSGSAKKAAAARPSGKAKAKAPAPTRKAPAKAESSAWATDLVFDVKEPKLAVSLRLDADVLRFFRGFGSGYQTRINEVLKAFMHARQGDAKPKAPSRKR